ncbi:MAG TPA: hypothetical protein VLG40_00145 [Candidatus Saccharimonas sp.]|nr:hypothetical protein [Candidatus Saccharimonas sp.]
MSRNHKKRNKPYTGADATPSKPVVHRYTAVERSAFGEWWVDHKRIVRIAAIAVVIAFVVVFILAELLRLVF